jgi:hypothetical protein
MKIQYQIQNRLKNLGEWCEYATFPADHEEQVIRLAKMFNQIPCSRSEFRVVKQTVTEEVVVS